jgi:hypothetical protein
LGLWPKQALAKVQDKIEARKLHFMLSGMQQSVKEWNPTLPSEFPLWELESQWIPKFSKGNCKGYNSLDWKVIYIIKKLLECRCPNWARVTHLGTKTQVMAKRKVGVNLSIWLSTIKS